MNKFISNIAVWMFLSTIVFADDSPHSFSGYMMGDYYWVAAHHDSTIDGATGFWFRRIYFTYENQLTSDFSVRMRLEMASAGDFSTSSVPLVPFVKDAYLKWKISKNHQLLLGISSVPTWGVVEKTWGYRFLEKTPLDLQKWGSSRDFGVALKGNLKSDGKVKYHFLLGNGSGNKSETNKGKKILGAISYYPTKQLVLEGYADWNDNKGNTDWYTLQGFAAYKTENATIGLQYAYQVRQIEDKDDSKLSLASAFVKLKTSQKLAVVARVDRMFDPNSKAAKQVYIPFDPTAKSFFFVVGLDFIPIENVHLMPNVEVIIYDKNDEGVTPHSDAIPRISFYYKFK